VSLERRNNIVDQCNEVRYISAALITMGKVSDSLGG
jgi:hypothetical protein